MIDFSRLPEQASTFAPVYDALFYSVLGLTGVVAAGVFVLIVHFAYKYRVGSKADRGAPPAAAQKRRDRAMEVAWIAIPLVFFLAIFGWAAGIYFSDLNAAPANALQIFVVAKQWMWKVEHTNGGREINELHVPRGYPVKLVMTSQDVIHSFFVPAFRVKRDVLPGRYATLWFQATRAGEFHLFCAEYCGTDHSRMGGRIVVMEPAEYQRWLNASNATGTTTATMAERGSARFRELGCGGCHGIGSTVRAPRLEGLFGRPVPLQDGRVVVADQAYIRDSILLPSKDVAAGYAPVMPSYAGQVGEDDLLELAEYIASLADVKGRAP